MGIQLLDLPNLINILQNIKGKDVDFIFYLVAAIFVFILSILKETSESKKTINKDFEIMECIMETILGSLIGGIILYLFGVLCLPFAVGIGVVSGFYIHDKYFILQKLKNNNSEKDININIYQDKDEILNKGNQTKPQLNDENLLRIKELNKDGNYDILDILYIYNYISKNHYEKLIVNSLFETPEQMVKKLLSMTVLTEKELIEARVILNVIRLKNKIISKEEALEYLCKKEN